MTLPASGAISFNAINVELGQPGATSANINQASYRTLAGIPSGTISLSSFYGKSNSFSFTISSNQTNANLASLATAAGWNGSSNLVATINAGVYISSNSTGTPALTVSGAFPGGVSLTNNGTIVGMGGAGGRGAGQSGTAVAGSGGGLALSVSSAITINNASGTIAGGGGGGGGGGATPQESAKTGSIFFFGAGGGGGGRSSNAANSAGGAAGAGYTTPGGAGGAGTVSSAGSGGGSGGNGTYASGGVGGAGGGWGSSGSAGATPSKPGIPTRPAGGGGSGGGAVSGNANITWTATGTRTGGIS